MWSILLYNSIMSSECLSYCPHVTECIEKVFKETQSSAPSRPETVAAKVDALAAEVARAALANCQGPTIEIRTVRKNGYWESKRPVERRVYVCSSDGHVQGDAFYYRKDKMPE
jgi:hypothetical protein